MPHRCLWSGHTGQPRPVRGTLASSDDFHMAWSRLNCKLQTTNVLVPPNSAWLPLPQTETPQTSPEDQRELVFSCGRGVGWLWSHSPNCYHTWAEAAFLNHHISEPTQAHPEQQQSHASPSTVPHHRSRAYGDTGGRNNSSHSLGASGEMRKLRNGSLNLDSI